MEELTPPNQVEPIVEHKDDALPPGLDRPPAHRPPSPVSYLSMCHGSNTLKSSFVPPIS